MAAARDLDDEIGAYFEWYQECFNEALRGRLPAGSIADLYAEAMIAAHPEGVDAGMNGKEFAESLEQGFQYYRILGTQKMTVQRVEVTRLDDLHAMARVAWRASYIRKSDGKPIDIDFENIYFLQNLKSEPEAWRVFGYITGDEQAAYEEHGLA